MWGKDLLREDPFPRSSNATPFSKNFLFSITCQYGAQSVRKILNLLPIYTVLSAVKELFIFSLY